MTKFVDNIAPFLIACVFLVETISASPSGRQNNEDIDIKESLGFIINHPLNRERPARYLLGPPLTEEEIVLTLQPVVDNIDGSNLEQLFELYQVTNGLKTFEAEADGLPLKDMWLIPGYYLLSLREVVETLSTMKKTSSIWNPTWLPLFSSRAGDFLVYDAENGHINEIFTKESLRWEVAPNIQDFLQGIARKLSDGRIFINENGLMDEITSDGQKDEGHEDKILDPLYLSTNVKNTFSLNIIVEEEDVAAPDLVFNCDNMPNVCQNIRNAINNGKTRSLQRITDATQIRKNRQAACGSVQCSAPNNSCDEYPFASTSQGGAGATTKCVPLSENNSQGGQLAGFYKKNNVGDKDWFNMKSP